MSRVWSSPRRHKAFTLIELLVVIVIVAILAAVAFPVYNTVMVKSRQTATLSNMRQVGTAFILYSQDNNYQLPNRVTNGPKWPSLLVPYVQNLKVYMSPIPDYIGKQNPNPTVITSDGSNGTCYILSGYNDIGAYNDSTVAPRLNGLTSPGQVALLGIKKQNAGDFYMDTTENNEIDKLQTTAWPGGSIYVFCDGSSRFLKFPPPGNNTRPNFSKPTNSDYYTDWWWLMDKSHGTNP